MAEAVAAPALQSARVERAWQALDGVMDPEVPAVSVRDLGIVRDVRLCGDVLDVVLKHTKLRNRGIKKEGQTPRKRLGVMRESGAVCLLEVCFITNPGDMKAYDATRDAIAKDLADVLVKHDAKR